MGTLEYIINKYNIDISKPSPFTISCGRWEELPKLFKELDFKVGAEIGVLQGDYTKALCEAGMKMFGIDAWTFYHTYKDFRKQSQLTKFEEEAREKLSSYDCTLIKGWSMDVVKTFEDETLDFVFIDGNHAFEYVTNDIAEWSKKIKPGGIISGHDFDEFNRTSNFMHVIYVVPAWCKAHKIHPWFILKGNKYRSWMWVKE